MTEQKYTNKNRIYYHGFRPLNPPLKSSDEFYLTTSFLYAASYAGKKGKVWSYRLKRNANIFNLKSKKDIEKIKNNDILRFPDIDFDELANRDWFSYFKGNFKQRRLLLNVIELMKYDGYFNNEIDDELVHHSVAANLNINLALKNSPSIGIFNDDCLEKIEVVDDIANDPRIKEYKQAEFEYFIYTILKSYESGTKNADFFDKLYELSLSLFNFTNQQLIKMFMSINPNQYADEYVMLKQKFENVRLIEGKRYMYNQRPVNWC